MDEQSKNELLDLRARQIEHGVVEAIRREVEWLRRHNFSIWVEENGAVVDASNRAPRDGVDATGSEES